MKIHKNPAGRNALTNLFKGKIGVEVGTERGKYAEKIAQEADKLFCVDLWKSYGDYRNHVSDDFYEEIYQDCKDRLKGYNVELIREDSVKAADLVENGYLDFVYIDAAHDYESVKNDLLAWIWKVKRGGIVSGHDYVKRKGFGVIEAVHHVCEYLGVDELTIWTSDKSPSWHFVMPIQPRPLSEGFDKEVVIKP